MLKVHMVEKVSSLMININKFAISLAIIVSHKKQAFVAMLYTCIHYPWPLCVLLSLGW